MLQADDGRGRARVPPPSAFRLRLSILSVQRVRARRAGGVAAQIADHRVLGRSYPLVESQWAEQSDELASVMFRCKEKCHVVHHSEN